MTVDTAKTRAKGTRKDRATPPGPAAVPSAVEGLRRILQIEAGLEMAVHDQDNRPLMSLKLSRFEAAHIVKWLVGRHDLETARALEKLALVDGPDATTRAAMAEVDGVDRWFKTGDELFDALEAAE